MLFSFYGGGGGGSVPYEYGKPNAHSLMPTTCVMHHIVTYTLVPQGGHRDEVCILKNS